MQYKTLPQATKAIISDFGEDVVKDIKFVNILSDVYDIESIPGAKNILRKILSDGYGKEIFAALKKQDWEVKTTMLCFKVFTEKGFKEDVTKYIFDSFVYGSGLRESPPELFKPLTSNKYYKDDLEVELRRLKNDYLSVLEDSIEIPDDCSGYFTANAKSDLFELKEKIILLGNAIGKEERQWCIDKENETLEKYNIEPKENRKIGFFKRLFGIS